MKRRFFHSRGFALALAFLATLLAAGATWFGALEAGRSRAAASLDSELQVLARSVESEIERFRYLPSVIARDGRIRALLTSPSPMAAARANAYLADIRTDSRVDELYVMTTDGLTVAASNHDKPSSFVGRNYRFRPYFQHALIHGAGRYYAVGVTTGEPGYFLASIIRQGDRELGVAVVKVDMRGLETAWEESRSFAAITDSDGVVFLTGYEPWKYKPLRPLGEAVLARIAVTRKYDGIDLANASPIFPASQRWPDVIEITKSGGAHLVRSVALESDQWRLWAASSLAPIRTNAALYALLVVLVGALFTGAGFYLHQRRQLIRAKLDAHDRLERRVVERTAELHREVDDRRRAEDELRTAQASLIQAAKLAALGRMSTAIVHEVSQPLAAMENTLASTGLLAERGDAKAVSDKVRVARDLVRRIQRTVKSLKSFARNEPARRELVDADRVVAVALELAAPRIAAEGAIIEVRTLDERALVSAHAIRLEQVVLNLVLNALDAVRERENPMVCVRIERSAGSVHIHVTDNGPGVPDDVRERITEPFFTTKITGEGLGLGLSISRALINEFGGSLVFDTKEGEGTTFTVSLPEALADLTQEAAE